MTPFPFAEAAHLGSVTGAVLGVVVGGLGMAIVRRRTSEKRLRAAFNGALLLFCIVGLVLIGVLTILQALGPNANGSIVFFLTSFIPTFAYGSFLAIGILLAIETIGRMRGKL